MRFEAPGVTLINGDCLAVMPTLEAGSVDAIVTDPPYGLAFMGKAWDHGIPGVEFWEAAKRVAKPGAFLAAFGGTRTFHRLACAIEDAGWEIRDTLCWHYGTGFPKSKSCLKPGWEPIILAKAPGTLRPLGIDECRLGAGQLTWERPRNMGYGLGTDNGPCEARAATLGRWPANVLLTHSPDCNGSCVDGCPVKIIGEQSGEMSAGTHPKSRAGLGCHGANGTTADRSTKTDSGTAARFFYTSKASRAERGDDNSHPTVKPIGIMEWLTRLVCPPGGTLLDPFIGSGTTAIAAMNTGRKCIGVERDAGYFGIASDRVNETLAKTPLFAGEA